jgi:hypothetical protein
MTIIMRGLFAVVVGKSESRERRGSQKGERREKMKRFLGGPNKRRKKRL